MKCVVVIVCALLACGEPVGVVLEIEVTPTCTFCDDGDACTDDLCVEGRCVYVGVMVEQACLTHEHCDDGNECTSDTCEPFLACGFDRCQNRDVVCDDGDACTRDICTNPGGCTAVPLDAGVECQLDADCDDTDPCTRDTCVVMVECPRARCQHEPVSRCGVNCVSAATCPRGCNEAVCFAGQCHDGDPLAGCDLGCSNAGSEPADAIVEGRRVRGIAMPVACTSCPCTTELELAGSVVRASLMDGLSQQLGGEVVPWGSCEVDVCVGTATCEPLVAGRGYVVLTTGAEGKPGGSKDEHALFVRGYCLATSSELMVGAWTGQFVLDEEEVRFDAWVAPVEDSDNLTRMVIAGTDEGVGIPAQTVYLPDGGVHLDTSIETDVGTFEGTLYTSPSALSGYLFDGTGRVAKLSFVLR